MDLQLGETTEAGASRTDAPGFSFSNPRLKGVSPAEARHAVIERVISHDEETGRALLEIKSPGSKNPSLISCRLPFAFPGQSLTSIPSPVAGASTTGAVEVLFVSLEAPVTERALRKFLGSDAFPRITPKIAKLLAKGFPGDFFQTLDSAPLLLKSLPGIGAKRCEQIEEAWEEFKFFASSRMFFFERDLPLVWADRLASAFGKDGLSLFLENPYRVGTDHGLSFDLLDPFALERGVPASSPDRLRACLIDLLREFYQQGHCAYPEDPLLSRAREKLGVDPDEIEDALEIEILEERFITDRIGGVECVYLSEIWKLEREVARKLLDFERKTPSWGWVNSPKVLGWAQSLLDIQLAPLQKTAIETALSSSLTVITGGPGTGKTTLIRSLVTILNTQFCRFALCSPTGRAAQRLEDATGAPAQTLHRLLKYDGLTDRFAYDENRPLPLDLVLIDEVSMVDLALFSHLLDALPEHCALILVGDADQLPSIGPGTILQSLIASRRFPTVRLTEIFRQQGQSRITLNAGRINAGRMPANPAPGDRNDFHYLPVQGVQATKEALFDLLHRVIPGKYGITDPSQCQVLVPLNRGELGTQQLNLELQKLFAREGGGLETVRGMEQVFKEGDKVMVTRNDYRKGVFNGDIGFIRKIDSRSRSLEIHFETKTVRFEFDELDRLSLAYAISIHKAQGSEYRVAIVVIAKEHLPLAQRHLLYTAVTRGKEHVFLVADPEALREAVSSDENNRRWQKLTELLTAPAT